jgi:hypothetical protein
MKQMFKAKPRIAVRDQMLVLTLPDAQTPSVWQLDMASVRGSVIEVVAQGNNHVLRFRNVSSGTTQDIAVYPNRDGALAVMTQLHNVLSRGWGTRLMVKIGYVVGGILLLWVLLNIIAFIGMATQRGGIESQVSPGVAQSADDVLKARGM